MKFKDKCLTAAIVLSCSTPVVLAGNATTDTGIDLSSNAPNRYIQCLTSQARAAATYREAQTTCERSLSAALTEIPPEQRDAFRETTQALYESGALRVNDQPSTRRYSGKRNDNELVIDEHRRLSRAEFEHSIFSKAFHGYANCVAGAPGYRSNLEQAKDRCVTERASLESLLLTDRRDQALATIDELLMTQWRRASENKGDQQ